MDGRNVSKDGGNPGIKMRERIKFKTAKQKYLGQRKICNINQKF